MHCDGSLRLVRSGILLAFVPALLAASPAHAQDCLIDYELVLSPPPEDGTYGCGETVTFCLTIETWSQTSVNWLHGVAPTFGAGWDMSTLTPGVPPGTLGGSGTWGWYDSVTPESGVGVGTVGPGFFFDLDDNGNPGDNYGDNAEGPWTFCWTITVNDGPDCIDGADLTVTVETYGDSESGSWGSAGCDDDEVPATPPLSISACPTAGIGYPLVVCETFAPIDLLNGLGGDPGGTWNGAGSPYFDGNLMPATAPSGPYTYTLPASSNCPETSATVDVTVNQLPEPGHDADMAYCETEDPADLTPLLGGGQDAGGYWAGPAGALQSGIIDPATELSGPYLYTVVGLAPCPTLYATINVTVDHLPDPGMDTVIWRCIEAPPVALFSMLGDDADAGGSWRSPDGQSNNGLFVPATDLTGKYTYTIAATGACTGQLLQSTVGAFVFTSPDATFVVDTMRGCVPFDVGFALNTPGPLVASHWYFGDGVFSDELPQLVHSYSNTGTFSPHVTVTDTNGCKTTETLVDAVRSYAQPQATFSYNPLVLRTYFDTHAKFTASEEAMVSYEWTMDNGMLFGRTVDHTFPLEPAADYEVCLAVVDTLGCTAQQCDMVTVHEAFNVTAPNCFTPNGDSKNDTFAPFLTGIDVRSLSFQIFDRWGRSIYQSNSPDARWNGGVNGGSPLPEGVYIWHLVVQDELTAEQRDYIGHVTLLH